MKQHIVFLDYLRAFACFLVVMVHVNESYYGLGNVPVFTEDQHLWMAIWDGLSRISVPLFIITSAYLLAPIKESMTWGDFFKKRLLRILPPFMFFLVIYSVAPALWGEKTWHQALSDLVYSPINFPDNAYHLWFMYPLLGLYLLIPFMSPWLRVATKRQEQLFLFLWFITTLMPWLKHFTEATVFGQCWWNEYYMLYDFSGYPGYLVLGHYLRTHIDWSDMKRRIIGALSFVIGSLITILSFYYTVIPGTEQALGDIEFAWCFCVFNCVIATTGAFLLFSTIKGKQASEGSKTPALVSWISADSFGMYLMHVLWLNMWVPIIKSIGMPISIEIVVIAFVTYLTCFIVTHLLSYLPKMKYVIGVER